jgi:hydrogenase maturation protease
VEDALSDIWAELERAGPESGRVGGVEVRRGSRVRLRPRPGRDAWDALLAGKDAVVERLEEDTDGVLHIVVALADDPARGVGGAHPGHRYFFAADEVEPLAGPRVLVAGIGNVFLGDDGFGSAVAEALADAPLPDGVDVRDFGVRGVDLAYSLGAYDAVVLVDAVPLEDEPGTLAVIEPDLDDAPAEIETHAMDPVRVLRLARILVVGCRPQTVVAPDDDVLVELSAPVCAAVPAATAVVQSLVEELVQERSKGGGDP